MKFLEDFALFGLSARWFFWKGKIKFLKWFRKSREKVKRMVSFSLFLVLLRHLPFSGSNSGSLDIRKYKKEVKGMKNFAQQSEIWWDVLIFAKR